MLRPLTLGAVAALLIGVMCSVFGGAAAAAPENRPNILIITVDDMSCDSVGAFGCKLPDTSPKHLDFPRQPSSNLQAAKEWSSPLGMTCQFD